MEKPISKSTHYVTATAYNKDLLYLIGEDRGLNNQGVAHTRIIAFDRNQNFYHNGDYNWRGVGIGIAKEPATKVVAIGENGEVFCYAGGKTQIEQIVPRPICLRNMKFIDGLAFACGMKREVFCRTAENTWIAMSADKPKDGENAGLESIAGYSRKEIYSVGWNGEIWKWDGAQWEQCPKLVSQILTSVTCAEDGKVYVCGQSGALISGRNQSWDIIRLNAFSEDFWDLHWFNGKIYLATMNALYTYTATQGLLQVNFGSDAPKTCYRLTSAEGVLFSMGSDDVFCFDGKQWARID
jgi:hypothetical protein